MAQAVLALRARDLRWGMLTDGARWRPDLMTVNTGSRGNGGFEVTLTPAAKDLHSGRYGGVVHNALAPLGAASQPGHVCFGTRLIQENQPGPIEIALRCPPLFARPLHVGSVLLART